MALHDSKRTLCTTALRVLLVLAVIVRLLEGVPCNAVEYAFDGQCCQMCPPGRRVLSHCTEQNNTICDLCTPNTYMERPSDLSDCFECQRCDAGLGLEVNKRCRSTRNAVCECTNGYHCVVVKERGCEMCAKHSVSVPGQKVKTHGTSRSDTLIRDCPSGAFSKVEMAKECTKWRNCAELDLLEDKPGTSISDAVCKEKSNWNRIMAVDVCIVAACIVAAVITGTFVWRLLKERSIREYDRLFSEASANGVAGDGVHEVQF